MLDEKLSREKKSFWSQVRGEKGLYREQPGREAENARHGSDGCLHQLHVALVVKRSGLDLLASHIICSWFYYQRGVQTTK